MYNKLQIVINCVCENLFIVVHVSANTQRLGRRKGGGGERGLGGGALTPTRAEMLIVPSRG